MVPEQAQALTEQQDQTQTQPQASHQEHWERTVRTTQEMVEVLEQAVAESTAVRRVMPGQVTMVEQAVRLGPMMRPVEQKVTARV